MKAAFTGLHSSGKTTTMHDLAGSLKEKNLRVHVIEEVARRASEAAFDLHRDKGFQLQLWVVATQIRMEIEAQRAGYDAILVERPVMDALPFSKVSIEDGAITSEEFEMLENLCWRYNEVSPYNYIFILGRLPQSSKEHHEEETLHHRIAEALTDYFDELRTRFTGSSTIIQEVNTASRHERKERIEQLILTGLRI